MRPRKPRKKKNVVFKECSECKKMFEVDDLKIFFRQFRLVCKDCFLKLSEIFKQ